jgi:hypothetical protein
MRHVAFFEYPLETPRNTVHLTCHLHKHSLDAIAANGPEDATALGDAIHHERGGAMSGICFQCGALSS